MSSSKHGHTTHKGSSPTYKSWHMMMQRCTNPNNQQYKDYGGRGIYVCQEWFEFAGFLASMGVRPEGTSIERIDNNSDYTPENCKWATRKEQQNNQRGNVWIEFNGETRTQSDWAERIGLKPHSLYQRLQHGWTVENALTTPPLQRGNRANSRKSK